MTATITRFPVELLNDRAVPSSPARSAAAAAPRTRLRLTRRGRVVFSALAAFPFVVAIAIAAANGQAATATSPADANPASTVTVQAGQSLWALAELVAPSANPADVVADIIAVNDLDGGAVEPGQTLVLPAAYVD